MSQAPEFVDACRLDELPVGEVTEVRGVGGRRLILIRTAFTVLAFDGYCTHRRAPMGRAHVEDDKLVCPWHDGSFDLKTGEAVDPPVDTAIESFETRVVDGQVQVRLGSAAAERAS